VKCKKLPKQLRQISPENTVNWNKST